MRPLVLALILLAAPLAGCLTGADDDPPGNPPQIPPGNDRSGDGGPGNASGSERPVSAPSLIEGLAWTYETTGLWNTEEPLTVVVARANSDGYLFAGGGPDDLLEDVHWNRSWLGWQTLSVNPRASDGQASVKLFDFPLEDGKTWSYGEGTVEAERTQLQTPLGTVDGFRMTVDGTDWDRTWTFAPRVGYLTSYEASRDSTVYLDLELTGISRAPNATWYTTHGSASTEEGAPPASLDVPEEATAVTFSAGAGQGGQVAVAPPVTAQQTPWTFQVGEEPSWTFDARPAATGPWTASASAPPDGFAFVSIAAVAWTPIEIG